MTAEPTSTDAVRAVSGADGGADVFEAVTQLLDLHIAGAGTMHTRVHLWKGLKLLAERHAPETVGDEGDEVVLLCGHCRDYAGHLPYPCPDLRILAEALGYELFDGVGTGLAGEPEPEVAR